MFTLLLVESPTKSKTLQNFLGSKYKVLSSYGHIRDLPKAELGVDTDKNFEPKYVIPQTSRKRIKELKDSLKKAQTVILATDEDREGESIAWHLLQVLNLGDNYQRIVFHEITKQAIEQALKNPRKIDMNLVDAQQARRILDRLVGYKLSPFLWKKITKGLSAGRVQSVVVRLVVEREKEIENFKPQEYWQIEAFLKKIPNPLEPKATPQRVASQIPNKSQAPNPKSKIEFKAFLIKKGAKAIPKLGIESKQEAEKIVKDLKGAEYKVLNVEKKEVKRNPLPPFTTSTLQQTAWSRLKFGAKMTMSIAQILYEKGHISYHRTDSLNLSKISQNVAKNFIEKIYGKEYWPGFARTYKTKSKLAQEAHEAIRPTYPEKTPENLKDLDSRQFKLYDLIWRRFIASQMNQALFDSSQIDVSAKNPAPYRAEGSGSGYVFRTSGQILKFDGFLKVYPIKFEEAALPPLEKNEVLEFKKLTPSQHFTKPPSRYSEATLIKTLEKQGIGRPSTYAPTLDTIQQRNYVQKDENKKFQPTQIGILVNNMLTKHFSKIVDVKFTAEMEEDLDKIAQGKENWVKTLKDFYTPFEKNLKEKYQEISKQDLIEKTDKTCKKCGSPMIIRWSRYGKFYGCSAFPKCDYKEPLEKKTLGIPCPKCKKGEIVEKRTRLRQGFGGQAKKQKIFYGCNRWPECDFALWDKPTGELCDKCGSLLVETNRPVRRSLDEGGKQIYPVKSRKAGIPLKAELFNRVKCSNKECDYGK